MSGAPAGRTPFAWSAPTAPLAAALVVAPFVAVLQSKAMAPLALVALALAVVQARRATGRWPWPRGPALWAGLALGLWGTASALWAPEPGRALSGGLGFAGTVLLAGAAYRAAGEDSPGRRAWLGQALVAGLALGLAAALLDHLTGSGLRAAVRGLREIPPQLAFGLKPAASVMALLLPLVAAAALPRRWRVAGLALGGGVLLWVSGDTARLAAAAGLILVALTALERRLRPGAPAWTPRLLGLGMAAVLLATPLLLGPALRHLPPSFQSLPPSAVHRLVIWDFGMERAREKPLLGWGLEAARALPGGKENPSSDRLSRLGVERPGLRAWFAAPHVELMPLHPHNGALQIWLELGWVGVVIAALALLLLAFAARGPAAAAMTGALGSAFITFLASFGAWQSWWLCSAALALACAGGLPGAASARAKT